MLSEYLLIGQVLRPQGINGLVKVRTETDDPARFADLKDVYIKSENTYMKMKICDVSVREDGVYLRLNGAMDRNAAEKQRNLMLYVDRAHARELEEDENFICDLIDCQALDSQGRKIGIVKDILQPGGNDVYVIQTPRGEMLVPALKFVIPSVHPAEGYIVLDESRLQEVAVLSWE